MCEVMKSVLLAIGIAAALQAMKMLFGYGPTLFVATAAFSFCIGALWGAGKVTLTSQPTGSPSLQHQEQKHDN